MLNKKFIRTTTQKIKGIKQTFPNKIVLRSMLRDKNFKKSDRVYFALLFSKYSGKSSISSFRRYCVMSQSTRSVFRLFRLSRHFAKQSASLGELSGFRKSSF
jgi:ribosomal protein S14